MPLERLIELMEARRHSYGSWMYAGGWIGATVFWLIIEPWLKGIL